jgi:hypothetical protein
MRFQKQSLEASAAIPVALEIFGSFGDRPSYPTRQTNATEVRLSQ